MGARNVVLAGDYENKSVMNLMGSVEIRIGLKTFPLNKDTVESYEVVDKEGGQSGGSSTFVDTEGNVIMGVASSTKAVYTLAINFKDGKRSLIEVDEKRYEILRDKLFDIRTQPKVEATSSADELMKWKSLLDQGVITAEEFEAKKKQLLGL